MPLAGLTAYQTLVHHLRIRTGDTVLIHGASGGVGTFAVQIARALKARVAGTASEANHEYLRGFGAIPFTYGDGLVDEVREFFPEGVDAVLDLNGSDLARSPELLSDSSFGRITSVIDPVTVKELGGHYAFVQPDVRDLDALTELIDAGKVKVEIAETYALADAAKAWEQSQTGHTRGKLVITVD